MLSSAAAQLLPVLLLVSALLCCSRECTAAAPPACTYEYDVHQTWYVTEGWTNFYRPGNKVERDVYWDTLPPGITSKGQRRYSILVNESFPGPQINAKVGDWIRIDVYNQLMTTAISIHWHGMKMRGTPWADGSALVTSCPIPAMMSGGDNYFSYIFKAEEAGTFWWHGHTGLEQDLGVDGVLIVTDPNDPFLDLYDKEEPIYIQEWWREPLPLYTNVVKGDVSVYTTIDIAVINGFWGNGTADFPYPVVEIEHGQCTRLRFINGNSETEGWQVRISGSNMTVIAVDSHNVAPMTVQSFMFYAAQRVDAIVCADMPTGDYQLSFGTVQNAGGPCMYIAGCQLFSNATLRVTASNATSKVDRAKVAKFPTRPVLDLLTGWEALHPYVPKAPPQKVDKVMTTYVGFSLTNGFTDPAYDVPPIPFVNPSKPLLFTKGTCGLSRNNDTIVYKIPKEGSVVDIIINNLGNNLHMMHLHGHSFWVLGGRKVTDAGDFTNFKNQTLCPNDGLIVDPSYIPILGPANAIFWGCKYNESTNRPQINTVDPYLTDTVTLPPRGWVYIRVKFDNPGMWYFHCHLTSHMLSGMGFVFNVAPSKQVPIPAWVDTSCGGPRCHLPTQECGIYNPAAPKACVKPPSKSKPQSGYWCPIDGGASNYKK